MASRWQHYDAYGCMSLEEENYVIIHVYLSDIIIIMNREEKIRG
jgi:hypothetical protein